MRLHRGSSFVRALSVFLVFAAIAIVLVMTWFILEGMW